MRYALATLFFMLLVPPLLAQEAPDGWGFQTDVNEKTYSENCASCHGDNLEGAALGPALVPGPLSHGNELADIIQSIKLGYPKNEMPAWQNTLSASQIERLAMLILELQAGFTYDSVDPKGEPLAVPTEVQGSEHHAFTLTSIASDIQHPFSIAPLPDGSILYTEKSVGLTLLSQTGEKRLIRGTPRVYDDNTFRGAALIGSGWIQEVALHPGYSENGWIYLSYGDRCDKCNALSKESGEPVTMTTVVRGRIEGDHWLDEQLIWRADTKHYLTGHNQALGARIDFDDKGHVFLTVGGISQEAGVQDLDKPYGKIHRVMDNGRIPPDNPFVQESAALPSTWSLGHRNPQGLAFDVATGRLWSTEHGPRGGDELNEIRAGANYGWPMVSFGMWYDGSPINFAEKLGLDYKEEDLTFPVRHWTPSPGISSIVVYRGQAFPKWRGNLFVTTMRQQRMMRLTVNGAKVVHEEVMLDGLGRIRDIEVAPNGDILLLIEQFYGSHILRMAPAP